MVLTLVVLTISHHAKAESKILELLFWGSCYLFTLHSASFERGGVLTKSFDFAVIRSKSYEIHEHKRV